MDEIIKELKERLNENQRLTAILKRLLRNCPEGDLRLTTTKGYPRYYWINGDEKQYINKNGLELKKGLANKAYYQKLLKETEEETKTFQNFLKHFDPRAKTRVYDEMHKEKKRFVDPLILPDDLFVKQWLEESRTIAETYRNSHEKPEGFRTENGELVRSKSEVILANLYKRLHVPYVYEYPVKLEDGWVSSDFRVLNIRLRKSILHEHFGKMDDPGYARDNIEKMHRYERSGFYTGEQILYTMETSERPLNVDDVERMIRKYVL